MRPLVPALVAFVIAASACSDGPDEAKRDDGAITEAGVVDVFATEVGDCLRLDESLAAAAEITELPAVPCSDEHLHEVFHLHEIEQPDVYPGPSELSSTADGSCLGAFEDYVGVPYLDSPLQFTYLYPSLDSWDDGDRTIACVLVSTRPLTASMQVDSAEPESG